MSDKVLEISKIDAAKRQLSEAIRLFFDDRDPVAIHTLACAAAQIGTDLAEKQGKFAPLRGLERLPQEKRSKWRRAIKSLENFFKHADKDPEATLRFPIEVTRLYLAEATALLTMVGSENTVEMDVFQAWFMLKYGRMMSFVQESKAFKHFDIPGTDLNDLRFFACLIETLNARHASL